MLNAIIYQRVRTNQVLVIQVMLSRKNKIIMHRVTFHVNTVAGHERQANPARNHSVHDGVQFYVQHNNFINHESYDASDTTSPLECNICELHKMSRCRVGHELNTNFNQPDKSCSHSMQNLSTYNRLRPFLPSSWKKITTSLLLIILLII